MPHTWRLLHKEHPEWNTPGGGKPVGYTSDCCALVIDEKWVWSPGEHIGTHVAELIARLLTDDMREVDWGSGAVRSLTPGKITIADQK